MSLVKTFFIKDASLEFILAILLKTDSNKDVFAHGFFMVTVFKLSKNFQRYIFAKYFLTKLEASNLQVATLLEITCLTKHIELAFNSKGYSYCVKKLYLYSNADADADANADAEMPMPRFPNGHEKI